ncbi:diaminopimelate dehydrogenase [Ruminiclostridium papyrosolvens DSM 2782]|uniref:Meso-diaminopimelate D-dehydrogenase n=1 Tax=Ruminiclostridium papyrosolvens DSM 2782 TaxID=588581 RepID=F1TC39_9FIRM|nr:diaminopimelate dehydrogenase [Ruminiclostridium papyrosolvens]EGD47954.1 diaminopimelate dehydrogenase [Ruminiclostridium papyrosolvens DSM 2782]WES36576.1 diaminopimelate dehydrogenase [Ruminiclostridium papyrosolvens DSM 2782]
MNKVKIGIIGYGNIGKGVEAAIRQSSDTELVAVFTRRNPESVVLKTPGVKVVEIKDAEKYKNDIDVMILCGGSATDLPEQGPEFAAMFNIVDSFDTHAKIPEYFATVNKAAMAANKTSVISVGWDPGLFSMIRMLSGAILPEGNDYTFWGKGVSQGHSDAIRRVTGVKNAIQYTIPIDDAVESVRNGKNPELSTRQKHLRECFVVAEEGADKAKIEADIKNMPNYFADYDTIVHFVSEDELKSNHSRMPHGGFVFRSGKTGIDTVNNHIIEFSLKLDSNPEFTANVLVAYARAAVRMNREGCHGAKTVFDVPLSYLSAKSHAELIKGLL